jgi:hypothetical protein
MICRVYCRDGGGLVLVPDCMLAPREAVRQAGPLYHCGVLDTAELPAGLAECIEREFDSQSYALLSEELEARLQAAASDRASVALALALARASKPVD